MLDQQEEKLNEVEDVFESVDHLESNEGFSPEMISQQNLAQTSIVSEDIKNNSNNNFIFISLMLSIVLLGVLVVWYFGLR